jgi:hypothetical protein
MMDKRQIAGYGFLVSLSATFIGGLMAATKDTDPLSQQAGVARMLSSGLAMGGNLVLARYGTYPVDRQMDAVRNKLASHLRDNDVPLLREPWQDAAQAHQERSLFDKIEDFLYAHPIETANAWGALTSAGLTASGYMRHGNESASQSERNAGIGNIAQGALITSAALASIFLPEKPSETVRAQGDDGTLWGDIQEHPLRYTNALFAAADLMQGHVAVQEWQKAGDLPPDDERKGWMYMISAASAIAMVTAISGEILVGSDSKKASGSSEALQEARQQLLESAAPVLASQPEACRHHLIAGAVDFLSRQPELRLIRIKQNYAPRWKTP